MKIIPSKSLQPSAHEIIKGKGLGNEGFKIGVGI